MTNSVLLAASLYADYVYELNVNRTQQLNSTLLIHACSCSWTAGLLNIAQ